ncbi:MAG: sigma-70 family RNA polymerase sigma factor [Acidimicrobiales bacterium]
MNEPDPTIIRAAAKGDHAAFADLVSLYQEPVWRFLTRYVGDAHLAEDLTQETFLKLHRRLGSYRFRSKFSTWVFSIARNSAIDAHRSATRRNRLPDVAPRAAPIGQPGLGAELDEALASLSPKLREALLLVEVLGLRYREVAEVLEVPIGTVKSRVFHARNELSDFLTDEVGESDGGTTASFGNAR